MTIYLIDSKPHLAVMNGFKPIPDLLYHEMIERGEIKRTEVIERD
jgi:hypothetical protein